MTFIIGYIYKDTVHIVADAAETFFNPTPVPVKMPLSAQTIFFEQSDSCQIILESANKLFNIEDRILLAFAGTVLEGMQTVEDIRLAYKHFVNLKDFFFNYFGNADLRKTEYIIGYYEDGKPHLFIYYGKDDFTDTSVEFSLAMAGKDVGWDFEGLLHSLAHANYEGYSYDDALTRTICLTQMFNLKRQTFREGVGGFMNGAYVNANGINWAKDAIYLLYSAINFDKGEKLGIYKYNRGNAVFIANHIRKTAFASNVDKGCYVQLLDTYGAELDALISSRSAEYYLLISYDSCRAVIINNNCRSNERIRIDNDRFVISGKIGEWMFKDIQDSTEALKLEVINNFDRERIAPQSEFRTQ